MTISFYEGQLVYSAYRLWEHCEGQLVYSAYRLWEYCEVCITRTFQKRSWAGGLKETIIGQEFNSNGLSSWTLRFHFN